MLVLATVVLGAVGVLFAVDVIGAWPVLAVTAVMGSLGIAAVGTFYAGLTVRLRAREVMLPLLMLPVLAPLLLAAVKATSAALLGDPFGVVAPWLQLLIAFDVVMLVAGAATYGFLLEDA
jgi:heme exporter protein B